MEKPSPSPSDIQEGDLHKISQIEFKGDIIFDEQEIRKKLKSKAGSTFKSSLFQADVATLTDLYQDKGYAFVDVAPFTVINDADKTVHVTFDIAKGSEVYFNRINIVGNIKTKRQGHQAGAEICRRRPLFVEEHETD